MQGPLSVRHYMCTPAVIITVTAVLHAAIGKISAVNMLKFNFKLLYFA